MSWTVNCGRDGCQRLELGSDTNDNRNGLGLRAPVGNGGRCRNYLDDVRKVQKALNGFPNNDGGPYPKLVEDGIVGPKTNAAILAFQRRQFGVGKADGVVDPDQRTDKRLAGPTISYGSLSDEMMAHIPQALSVISIARTTVAAARMFKATGPSSIASFGESAWNKASKHFQVDLVTDPDTQLAWVDHIFIDMQTAIGYIPQGIMLVGDEPEEKHRGALAYVYAGGYDLSVRNGVTAGLNNGTIWLCPRMQSVDRESFTYVLIHELAHFVGPQIQTGQRIDDYAYHHKGVGLANLLPWQRLHNADSFAQFAFDAAGRPFHQNQHNL